MPAATPVKSTTRCIRNFDGNPLTLSDLPKQPKSGNLRWTPARKATVVLAVQGGLLSLQDACENYTLTVEEFMTWQNQNDQHGLEGLKTTKIQEYRERSEAAGLIG